MRASHAVFRIAADAADAQAWLATEHPELRVMSAGSVIEGVDLRMMGVVVASRFLVEIPSRHAVA